MIPQRLRAAWRRWRPARPETTGAAATSSAARGASPARDPDPHASHAPVAATPAPDAFTGQRVAQYRIEALIGRGAAGAVYRARPTGGGAVVALKVLDLRQGLDARSQQEARVRFLRGAEAAQRLQHPAIVDVLAAGEARGLAWLAMPCVEGHDLGRHQRPNTLLPADEVLRAVADVAAGLAHAHRQGVVHGDVKPANLLREAAAGKVQLTDFGLARVAGGSRTRTGLVAGTPSYMPPEQLAGGPAGAPGDLYALGATLYQLLTGHLPHEAASLGALLHAIASQTAPPLGRWRPGCPPALEAVVARLLDRDPSRRPPDGDAVALELRALARDGLTLPPPP